MSEFRFTVIGGGTGPLALEDELLNLADVTSITTVTDNGKDTKTKRFLHGVSGVGDPSRRMGIHIRNNEFGRNLMWHRFVMNGSRVGNDMVAGSQQIEKNNLYQGIQKLEHLMRADYKGRVLPISNQTDLHLRIFFDGAPFIDGEEKLDEIISNTPEITGIGFTLEQPHGSGLYLPTKPETLPEALDAIDNTDANIIAPGSWHGSILAITEAPGVYQRLRDSRGQLIVYVTACDFLGWKASRYIEEIYTKTGRKADLVVLDKPTYQPLSSYAKEGKYPVEVDLERCSQFAKNIAYGPFTQVESISGEPTIRHDGKLSASLAVHFLTSQRLEKFDPRIQLIRI